MKPTTEFTVKGEMVDFKKITKKLENFGLSEKQALVYLLLVQNGSLRIQEIADFTRIPRSIVYVYSAYGRSKFVGKKFYMDFVKESQEKSIKERVLINPAERALSLIKRDIGLPLARTNSEDVRVLGVDKLSIKGETFIYDNVYAYVYLDGVEINGFEIENRDFVEMQRSIFEALWKEAKLVSDILLHSN